MKDRTTIVLEKTTRDKLMLSKTILKTKNIDEIINILLNKDIKLTEKLNNLQKTN